MILQELINDKISKFILFLIIKFDEKLIAKRDNIFFIFGVLTHFFLENLRDFVAVAADYLPFRKTGRTNTLC